MSNSTASIICSLSLEQGSAIGTYAVGIAVCASLLYEIYLVLSMRAIYILMSRGLRTSRPRCCLLAIILIMFLATTTLFNRDIQGALEQIMFLGKNPTLVLHTFQYFNVTYIVALCMLTLMSDAIVVWRAWVICNSRSVKRILSCCMLSSSVGIMVSFVSEIRSANGELEAPLSAILLPVLVPAFITNLVATLTIGHTAWTYSHTSKRNPKDSPASGSIHTILLLFIESGFLYIILWTVYVILAFIPSTNVEYRFVHTFAIYPVAIIILVAQRTPLPESKINARQLCLPPVAPSMPSTIIDIRLETEPKELQPISV
ncbi:hypothetical protein C8J56DRAFT_1054023 [Mycena floridula]|nr:hypothetical protein C8J56DRAFT_1054023 [Mycena floridula]